MIDVARSFPHRQSINALQQLVARYGRPRYIQSDNGPEFRAKILPAFLKDQGILAVHTEPGKPWQNSSGVSLNGTLRQECLAAELFHSLSEARVVIEG
jgi:putative transposase